MEARIPPTERCPLRYTSLLASAPFKNSSSKEESFKINGTFIRETESVVLNVKSEKVIPTLKRDNLLQKDLDFISFAIGKSLMLMIKDEFSKTMEDSINKLINNLYSNSNNLFLKEVQK